MLRLSSPFRTVSRRAGLALAVTFVVAAGAAVFLNADHGRAARSPALDSAAAPQPDGRLRLSASQWASIKVEAVGEHAFASEFRTEGKIAIDEDRATRIFAPYAGRVTRLLVAPGDQVARGQLVFVIEAADSVDAQKDFVAALTARNKTASQVKLAQTVERRMAALAQDKAAPLREWQEAQANLTAAENDARSAGVALQAARNRLRLVGKTDTEIDAFEATGLLTPDAPVYAPLSGTVLQRKVGPGQYVNAGASDSDPIFLIGDTSKVWLAAYVRESDAGKVALGQCLTFRVMAQPGRSFEARIDYIAAAIDPDSRRLLVRATVDNADRQLKPEMFASVMVVAAEGMPTPAVPLEAVIYEGSSARVWVVRDDRSLELRLIKPGLSSGRLIQVLGGLAPGEQVVTRGSLFIDRAAAINQT
jgi:cobalt-zinc-cadmium efflux system membrane fusion protein